MALTCKIQSFFSGGIIGLKQGPLISVLAIVSLGNDNTALVRGELRIASLQRYLFFTAIRKYVT